MDNTIKEKLAKVFKLVKHGTDGEKAAAAKALERIVKRHNIKVEELQTIHLSRHSFKYATLLEATLLCYIIDFFAAPVLSTARKAPRTVFVTCDYENYITIECSYEYFRRHMKAQYKKVVLPQLAKHKNKKTLAKRKAQLDKIFLSQYIIASRLYKPEDIKTVRVKSSREIEDRTNMLNVEGGKYNRQVVTSHLLN